MALCISGLLLCVLFVMSGALRAVFMHDVGRSKRADDTDPLRPVVEQLAQQVQQLQAQVETNKNNIADMKTMVGFTLRMKTHDIHGLGIHQVIKFDDIIFNAGNAYSPVTGHFTAPVSGTYIFMLVTMRHNNDDSVIMLDMMKNGVFLGRGHAGYSQYAQGGSGLYLVHLDQGDVVYVQVASGSGTMFTGSYYTVFSGFRVMP